MHIIKKNHLGEKIWEYDGELVGQSDFAYLFKATFNRADLLFYDVHFKKGDTFFELYPIGKWFNIYQIHDRDENRIKGWYCNVTRPVRVSENTLSYDDLALDLLVFPDRNMRVLDEDEFDCLQLDQNEIRQARNALSELKDIFSQKDCFLMKNYGHFFNPPQVADRNTKLSR